MKEQSILPVLSFLFAAATPLWADVTYYDPVGGTNATCKTCTTYTDQTTLTDGWYLVTGNIMNDTRIAVSGDAHLILADGASLTANAGINVEDGNSFTVWAQSDGANMGKLRATGVSDAAGIGGEFGRSGGMVTINGGKVTANGGGGGGGGGGGHTATVTGSEVRYSGTADVQWLNDTELLLKFIDDGSFVLPGLSKVRILAVGGGGGGAGVCSASSAMVFPYGGGAGGGAGGVVEITNILPAATYVVSVGAGGAGGASSRTHSEGKYNGASGGDTTLTTNGVAFLTAKGGGGGGGEAVGLDGGSGGGGSQYRAGSTSGQPRAGGSGTIDQGHAGGSGDWALYGGGGGGAGGAAAPASTLNPVGGDGRASDITCNDGEGPVWYAGGGGGGFSDKSFTGLHDPIAGGKGGGGKGGYGRNVACTDATFYGGGGGGGGAVGTNATTPGGSGYRGVVYVRISVVTSEALAKPTNQTVAFDGMEHVLVAASPAYVITDLTEGSPTYGQVVSRMAATDAGTRKAKVELVDGFKWSDGTKTVETVTLTINRATPVISDLRIRDWIAGTPDSATPNPSCRVSIAVEPTYEYGDSATGPWSAEKPTAVGTHYLRASIAETANCNAAESVSPFTIFNGPGDIYRDHVEITIGAASSPMSEFVYELRLSEGAPVGFLYERAGETGEDLTITDANGVVLDYTVGTWNTAGESRLYVKLPELSTSPQVIRLFWCVREGKTPPSHTACGIPSGDPQPSFDFDLVERAGKRVNYWLTSPSLTKTKWSTDDPEDEKGKVVSYGTVAEGFSSFLYAMNLNTGAISPGMPTTGGSFSAVFGPYDPVGDYEPFEYGIDVLVVGHGAGYGGGAGIGGGCWGNGGVIVINGGEVLANGGGSGAGIGGGSGGGAGGEVTISGGMVMGRGFNGGAGIGGGLDGSGGNVTITGGDAVSALSNSGGCAGIGGGAGGIGGTVTIKPAGGNKLAVEAGADAGSAAPVAGSPFAMETDVTSLLAGNLFVHVGKAFAEGDIALTDYAGTYDGLAHTIGIATNAIPGLVLRYSSSSSPSSSPSPSTTLPLFTDVTNVTVSVEASAPNYETFTTNVTVKIAPRTVTLTSGSAEKVYDGTPVTCTDVVVGGDGFLTSEGATYDVTGSQTHVGVGTNTFTYVLNAGTFAINYAIVTSNGTLTVTKATNAWTTDPSLAGWTYGETAGTPDFGGAAFGTATVTYSAEPGDAGDYTATFTVAGTDDYDGLTFEVPFTIARATFADGDIALTDYAGVYDGLAHTIGIATNAIPGLALQYSSPSSPASPSTTLPLFTDVTNVTVSVEASAPNYETFTTNATVTIAPRTVTLTSGSAEKVYDGTALTNHNVTVGGDGFVDGEGASYDVTGEQTHVGTSENAFTYTLNAGTDADNYEIATSNGTLTVTKATNAWTADPSIAGWTYGEAAGVPDMGGAAFGAATVTYSAEPGDAGDYVATFTIEGTDDYDGLTFEVPFTIAPAAIEASAEGYAGVYDGEGHGVAVTVTKPADGTAVRYSVGDAPGDWSVEAPLFTNACEATVWVEITAANYVPVTNSVMVKITQAENVWITEPSIAGWTCGEAASVPQMGEAKFGTVAVSYGASGTEPPSAAGDYVATFTVEGTENYSGLTKEVPFTIEPEPDRGGEEQPVTDGVFAGAVATQFAAGQEFLGALYDADGTVVGTVTLKFGKRNRRTGKVKLTASATIIVDGEVKKVGAKVVSFKADEWAAERIIEFRQPVGTMTLASEGGKFTLRNESYEMVGLAVEAKSGTERDVKVGGSLPDGPMRFRMEVGSLPTLPGGYAFVLSSFPTDVTMNISGVRRVVSGKASTRKVTLEYVIRGLAAAQPSKLKLTCSPKTGLFKGSFKVYATAGGDKPKRRTYNVKVVGFVVDGVGVGQATLRKPSVKWPITLE